MSRNHVADGKEFELSFLLPSWFFQAMNIRFSFMFEKHVVFCYMILFFDMQGKKNPLK